MHVLESEATKEFLEARRALLGWEHYKAICQMRNLWGEYLRSNLDWDWDTANYLEHLFKLPEETIPPTAQIATVSLNAGMPDTWKISTEVSLPKEVKIVYKSATGETKYKTFMPCPSSEDVALAVGVPQVIKEIVEVSVISQEEPCGGVDEANDSELVQVVEETEGAVVSPGPTCGRLGDVIEGSGAILSKDSGTFPAPGPALGREVNAHVVKRVIADN